MEVLSQIIDAVNNVLRWPLVIGLLGTGLFLTVRLGFIQFRRLGHGFAVATGRYDDPDEPGDVSHFQALTTALSATVGVGNIAGVALAIHIGGPGALFWMWITALLGMATKYSEVTLAQQYRDVHHDEDGKAWEGSVSGGPMYYIERGLGRKWKPVAVFFAFALMVTSFMTGNAVQANTVATQVFDTFGVDPWITGLVTATIVGIVILGGISRIGKVTSIVAPVMAAIYVAGALLILVLNIGEIPAAFGRIFSEAFNPTSGVAGTGAGVFLLTMLYGVQRGLFSNEAGQGSAPIAHSAAKTDEPVSEGAVALLEPFIDTILICTMTGLVLVTTGAFEATAPAPLDLGASNVSFVEGDRETGYTPYLGQDAISYEEGMAQTLDGPRLGRFSVGVDTLYVDEAQTRPFTGTIDPDLRVARDADGTVRETLYGNTVRTSAPLTTLAFERGLAPIGLGGLGGSIVLFSVILFAISTSISWSYYGDRCANYLFGTKAILPFKAVFVVMHFIGAVLAVTTIWDLGDVALSLVTLPNVLALILLSGTLKKLTDSYFERKPWRENAEVHKRVVAEKQANKRRPK
ncbi:sodium:alanine symporter family protein [Rubrivirga sp. S365]|uniref:Sodium:alanine symporter family protein n=1 Tax=Rubrivirga litoralis TaxID=3075598 RepID=A0ABU3BNK6_9BACT|nr:MULTISPECIES: sodium:alanine symporter family protein [unclassified Rubrivirga]MDT0630885.1 sodium:alanine symporter family protein [Rubrivirga sp. F394]MDT7857437.1 sodium:alanine symporter family protein [Rubrivirga sp. S365]